jgi:DNA replication and repair protein RecF
MTVNSVEFSSFRNIEDGVFRPAGGVNVLYGSNGQGKTNILEALWLFTGARSFRGAKDADYVNFSKEAAALRLGFTSLSGSREARLGFDGTRSAELEGIKLASTMKLSGEFCAVIFSPEHLELVKAGPQLRRRFIDSAICQILPRHVAAVIEYRKILVQRNSLLKDIPFHAQLLDTLDVWDEHLAAVGAGIIRTRIRYLRHMTEVACRKYSEIAGGGETLGAEYISADGGKYPESGGAGELQSREIAKMLLEKLRQSRTQDLESGYTHFGPHRDDLELKISGISAREFGSQGQQRTAVLALKLAEAAVIRQTINEPPVLLLDDVMSELDGGRQNYLLGDIDGMQVFITCCDKAVAGRTDAGHVFRVDSGRIVAE